MLAENCRSFFGVWSVLSYSRQVVVQHSSTVDDLIQPHQKTHCGPGGNKVMFRKNMFLLALLHHQPPALLPAHYWMLDIISLQSSSTVCQEVNVSAVC